MFHHSGRRDGNSDVAAFDVRRTIHSFFIEVARDHPDHAAVLYDGRALSYSELDRKSNQFARFLTSRGIRPGAIVGLFLSRSPEAIIAMLGVLKAGAAFAPLDPAYPADHLAFIASDAEPFIVVSASHMFSKARSPADGVAFSPAALPWTAPTLLMDAEEEAIARESGGALAETVAGDDLAYVMYTSGTTGRPKGVMVPHRGVTRLAFNSFVDLGRHDVVLHLAPLAFDASTFEIWSPLLNGAALAIVGAAHPSFNEIGAAIREGGVTTAWFTASLFHAIVDHQIEILRSLRQLIAGGDVLSPRHVRRVLDALPQCRLVNGYGPTENTTFTCCYDLPRDFSADAAAPIGRPIEHTRVYVLDQNLRPVPAGEEGELFAAGDGVALGYLKRPELTAEKFLPDPFCGEPGQLMYRTGDLVRRRVDGVIDFTGRVDRQVKIFGKRVELDEVEALLRRLPQVADAAVQVRKRTDGDRQIIAYVSSHSSIDPEALRRHMLDLAPDHLVPAHFVVLRDLPRTPNGKVDRASLPEFVGARAAAPAVAQDLNAIEATLAGVWSRLLKTDSVGVDANFFDLGGASLDVMALQEEIKARFFCDVPMTALFEFTTIRSLAAHLQSLDASAAGKGAEASTDRVAVDDLNSRKARQAEALKRASRRRVVSAS
ncbi:Amino acid adenylation domain protein [Methylocella tundrae]|uniref:Amino acid adenylation domain protein n=1 Tax=Methylocella tundrae TaxID=227605 RepID=A0A8B6M2U5_METTU|nr:Amino acid adenylation domain protein [Methylocella tundrae]VTZ49148.1 Amino acid adenylation domain protein [Methylocella tundrae]